MAVDNYDNARTLVNEKFDASTQYADEAWDQTLEYITELTAAIDFDVPFAELAVEFSDIETETLVPASPAAPVISVSLPDTIEAPTITVPSLEELTVPSFGEEPPALTIPDVPDVTFPSDPGEPPTLDEITTPAEPSYTLPDVPSLSDFSIPTPPAVSMPSFDGVAPTYSIEPPGVSFFYDEQEYASDLLDAARAYMEATLAAGGTGLGATAEAALWARARDRLQDSQERLQEEIHERWGAMGWNIPTGPLAGLVAEAAQAGVREETQLNYEISIEQAKLAYQNMKDTVQQIITLEASLLTHADKVAARAFESARYTQQAAIDVFNAGAVYYNLQLDAYKTEAAVFESRIQASILELQAYKLQLDSIATAVQIDKAKIDLYNAQFSAILAAIEVYKAQMEGANIKASVQRTKMDAFKSGVDAYAATIGGITARLNSYQTQVAGEMAKAQIYTEQTKAFGFKVEASKTQSEINTLELESQLKINDQNVNVYRAQLEEWNARVKSLLTEADLEIKVYDLGTTKYKADIDAMTARLQAEIMSYEVRSKSETNSTELLLKQAQVNLEAAIKTHEMNLEALKSSALVSAQLTASALGAVNASAALGYNQSFGEADTTSRTDPIEQSRVIKQYTGVI